MLVDRFGNAFQQLPNSEEEIDTGLKWHDGRHIFLGYIYYEYEGSGSISRLLTSADFDFIWLDYGNSFITITQGEKVCSYPINYEDKGSDLHEGNDFSIKSYIVGHFLNMTFPFSAREFKGEIHIYFMYVKKN